MSQFFADGETVELTPELRDLFDKWSALSADQKAAIYQIMKSFAK